jgi:spermidine synthase
MFKMPVISDIEQMARLENGVFTETACSADVHSNYPLRKVFWAGRTDFQDVVIAESPTYGKVLFLDGELQSSSSDEAIYHEHLVHPLLASLSGIPNKKVLVVGGGEGATVREVLRWSADAVASVDWVDIDGDLVVLCQKHLEWADNSVHNDSRLMFCPDDINSFLDRTPGLYDAIILDLPDPDVEMLNEAGAMSDALYGPRFRERIMSHLAIGGGIVTHCGPIRPGADTVACGMGMVWIKEQLFKGIEVFPYHVCIPSFQGEWGFMMTKAPTVSPLFPAGLRVMDRTVAGLAFTWPKYWTTL